MDDLREVFDAKPSSIYDLFFGRGTTGFFVPAYQREYAWDKNNLRRFFEDFCTGMKTYIEHEDAITFIGTVIAITDAHSDAFQPDQRQNLPSQVMLLIDGQQRVTSFSLIAIALVERLMSSKGVLRGLDHEQLKREIPGLVEQQVQALEKLFSVDMNSRTDDAFRYYPKITRAYVDQWSTRNQEAHYESPIAKFTHSFISHYFSNLATEEYEAFNYSSLQGINGLEKVIVNFEEIKKLLDATLRNENDDLVIPDTHKILSEKNKDKFGFRRITLSDSDLEDLSSEIKSLFNLLSFTHFALHRVAVTSVVCKNESYAFDMFESLNTTGEPLTAFETFKPKVIDSVGVYEYQRSSLKRLMESIEKDLNNYTKADQRQAATSKILVPFRSAFDGESLSKHLSEQRRFLNSAFEQMTTESDRGLFVKALYDMNRFINVCWQENKNYDPTKFGEMFPFGNSANEFELFISVLRDANHTITQGVIFRFFQNYVNSDRSHELFDELLKATKAIVAFFIIWRSTHHGTSGIDNAYKSLLKSTSGTSPAFSLKHGGFNAVPTSEKLKDRLKLLLTEKLGEHALDQNFLVQRSRDLPVYSLNKTVAKFLLLLTTHQTAPHEVEAGHVVEAIRGYHTTFSKGYWDKFRTIEHIFPQKAQREEWDASLIMESSLENSLGNLTILPPIVNSSLGNRSWKDKKSLFKILASEIPEQREKYIEEAVSDGVAIPFSTNEILSQSDFMVGVKSIAKVEHWNAEIVRSRGANLYRIAYSRLLRWLE